MKRSVTAIIVAAVTIFCILVVTSFSPTNRDLIAILIFSVLPSVPIYLLRRRYEKSVSTILERSHEEKLDTTN